MSIELRESQPAAFRPAGLVAVDGRTYPLESAHLEARAEGGLTRTILTQIYANPYDEALEVAYTLPLPADAAVVGYTIRTGDTVIRGEVQKRDEAQEAYRKAMVEGRIAALLEHERDDTFTQRLGSLPARQSARVEIETLQLLNFIPTADGRPPCWEYRFPTVAGIRYEGAPGRVPDAERLDADRNTSGDIPTRVSLDLVIVDGDLATLDARSPSHDVIVAENQGTTRVRLGEDVRLDRDVVVRWNACTSDVGARFVEGPGLPGDDGRYGLITLTPPAAAAGGLARDLIILLDASGSMGGPPLEWAKDVIEDLLESLELEDRFEILAFANTVTRLTSRPTDASEKNIRRAVRTLRELQAGGGTEMSRALAEALEPLRPDSQRQVVLVTDGMIGFESEIVAHLIDKLPAKSRVHTVGIGSAPNRALTRMAARAGRGTEVIVTDSCDVAQAASRLRQATMRPILTQVTVSGDAVVAVAPARPRDVYAGQPLVLPIEVRQEGGTIDVGADQTGTRDRWVWRIHVPAQPQASTTIPLGALYGREVVADLEMHAGAEHQARDAIKEKIEAAGLRHRIATRCTSLVAIADEPSVDPLQPRRRTRLAVEVPRGMSAEGAGLVGSGMFLGGGFEQLSLASPTRLRKLDAVAPHVARPSMIRFGGGGTIHCRVLAAEGSVLVLEFEVAEDRFVIEGAKFVVLRDGGESLPAEVVPERSSPRGPHQKGLTLRLALRRGDGRSWPHGVLFRAVGLGRQFEFMTP